MAAIHGRYWHQQEDGRFHCDLCPRGCTLRPGQRALCAVRGAGNDGIYLLSYGQSSGLCLDPIEKKPLNHFLPGTPVLSLGQVGCNLTCAFCQNWDISKDRGKVLDAELARVLASEEAGDAIASSLAGAGKVDGNRLSEYASPEDLAQACVDTGARSIAFTYNDPVIFLEYVVDTARACHDRGIKTVAVSAGYIEPEARVEFYHHIDAVNIDLKAFTDDFYFKLASAHLDPVLDTLKYIRHETDTWLEITTLLIPGENDGEKELNELAAWVYGELGADVPLHFSAFHPDYKMRDKPRTPPETLLRAHKIARAHGLNYVYVGNVHHKAASSTYCAGCGEMLIGRDWYVLSRWHLDHYGHCLSCGHQLAGRFEGPAGVWGARRQRVRLGQTAS